MRATNLPSTCGCNRASSLPESLGPAPGRSSSLSAASRLPITIAWSDRRSSRPPRRSSQSPRHCRWHPGRAKSARLNLRAPCRPPLRRLLSSSRLVWRKNLHAQAGAMLGVYPPVHSPASPAARESRHPAIFSGHTPFNSPNGADARTRRLHQTAATWRRSQYRSPRRSETLARVAVIFAFNMS
jgi:hypothetical protein